MQFSKKINQKLVKNNIFLSLKTKLSNKLVCRALIQVLLRIFGDSSKMFFFQKNKKTRNLLKLVYLSGLG